MVEVMKIMVTSFKKSHAHTATLSAPNPAVGHCLLGGSQQTGKFFKRWEYQITWPASLEICMQVKKQQLELDMEKQTGSKSGKEYSRLNVVIMLI